MAENSSVKMWPSMTEAELITEAFKEGTPPGPGSTNENDSEIRQISVSLSSEKIETHFGLVETEPFLELFWRKTGADCVDEEEEMTFPNGITYRVKLCD